MATIIRENQFKALHPLLPICYCHIYVVNLEEGGLKQFIINFSFTFSKYSQNLERTAEKKIDWYDKYNVPFMWSNYVPYYFRLSCRIIMSKTNHRYVFSIMLMKCFFLNNFMFCRYRMGKENEYKAWMFFPFSKIIFHNYFQYS